MESEPRPVRLLGSEGSLEELLRLANGQPSGLAELALAEVAGQVLTYLESQAPEDLERWCDFLVALATLLAVKARSLLPASPAERWPQKDSEKEATTGPDLAERMANFRRFRKAAETLATWEERRLGYGDRGPDVEAYRLVLEGINPLTGVTLEDLVRTWARVSGMIKETATPMELPRPEIDLAQLIRRLRRELRRQSPATLQELFTGVRELVFGLLAALILNQRGEVRLEQPRHWGPIYVYPRRSLSA
ncbi:MAG: segregation and condensation protein A [Moorellales bacterium]